MNLRVIFKCLKKISKEKFYSLLTGKRISDNEYDNKYLKDYHDLYIKCDILLLLEVFKKDLQIIT